MPFYTPEPTTHTTITAYENRQKEICSDVTRDPYAHLLTNWEKQTAKQIPIRMFFNAAAMGVAGLYYLSRHNELNRVKRLVFSIDMAVNVGSRAIVAGVVSDLFTRKLFVNYDKLTAHKVATNEVKKIMRTYPNARPYKAVHEKPNSYYYAM